MRKIVKIKLKNIAKKMNKEEKLKEYFVKYKFMQSIHFTKIMGVPNSTIKMFVYGKRKLSEKNTEKIFVFIENIVKEIVNLQKQINK